jgi:mannosyltransferase
VGAILVLPVIALSIRQDSAASWITRPTFHDLGTLFHDYFASNNVVAAALLICAVIALLPARTAGSPWWRRGGISLPSVAAPLLVVPAGVVLLESVLAHPVYVDRYVLFGETGAAMLAGAGVYRIGQWLADVSHQRAMVAVTGAVVCAAVLVLQLGPQHRARTPESRLFDYGDPAFYIGAHAQPGDGVMFFNWFFRKARLGYPEDFRNTTDFAMAISPQQSGTLNGFDKPLDVVRRLMLGYQRIWVVGRAPSDHVASVAVGAEGELLMRRFKLITERHYKSITVTLWQQR